MFEPNTKQKRRIAHGEPTNMRQHESLFAPVPRKSRLLGEHVAVEQQASHLRELVLRVQTPNSQLVSSFAPIRSVTPRSYQSERTSLVVAILCDSKAADSVSPIELCSRFRPKPRRSHHRSPCRRPARRG